MADSADSQDKDCSVCLQPLVAEGESSPVMWLSCCHPLHKYCLDNMMLAKGVTKIEEIRCPVCRNSVTFLVV